MLFSIENCSGNIKKIRSIEGIQEQSNGTFKKCFDTLEKLMEFVREQGEIIIYPSNCEEITEDTIRIYDSWNE